MRLSMAPAWRRGPSGSTGTGPAEPPVAASVTRLSPMMSWSNRFGCSPGRRRATRSSISFSPTIHRAGRTAGMAYRERRSGPLWRRGEKRLQIGWRPPCRARRSPLVWRPVPQRGPRRPMIPRPMRRRGERLHRRSGPMNIRCPKQPCAQMRAMITRLSGRRPARPAAGLALTCGLPHRRKRGPVHYSNSSDQSSQPERPNQKAGKTKEPHRTHSPPHAGRSGKVGSRASSTTSHSTPPMVTMARQGMAT